MPKAKKRALSTSSESSGSDAAEDEDKTAEVKPKKKAKIKTTPAVATSSAATSSSDEQGKAAKKLKKDKPEKPSKEPVVVSTLPTVKEVVPKKPAEQAEKVIKTTTVKDMLRAKRDKHQKELGGRNTDDESPESGPSSLAVSESSRDSHPENSSPPPPASVAPTNGTVKDISLPNDLPSDVATAIGNLKVTAEHAISTKVPFFTNPIKDQLVKIDNSLKALGASSRVQCFLYIADFAQCSKKTLFEKVRKHRVDQVAVRVKIEIAKLRKIVSETMKGLVEKFDKETLQYNTKLALQSVIGDNTEQSAPKKKYHWNDASRQALFDLNVRLVELFKIVKPKGVTQEEFIEKKYKDDVMKIWPEGWIKPEDFKKELDRKQKKEAKALAALANGKSSEPLTNGRLESKTPPQPTSVIKRSSDHSINSIISSTTSPSPPTTSHKPETPNETKPATLPRFSLNEPPATAMIDITSPEKVSPAAAARRSNSSSDSDCVEIVSEYQNSHLLNNNVVVKQNKQVNHHSSSHNTTPPQPQQPVAKKIKIKHGGSSDGDSVDPKTNYSELIMGLQSLTVRNFFCAFLELNYSRGLRWGLESIAR